MDGAKVVIKGEIHSSRGDLEEEREILVEGVDRFILEGPEEEAKYGITEQWYAWMMLIMEYLFARQIYVDKTILTDIADAQGAEIERTRESDLDVLRNSRIQIRILAFIIFIGTLTFSLYLGLNGQVLTGAGWLFASALLPLFILRTHESRRSDTGRDKQMAGQIEDAAKQGGRVVAVLGDAHAKNVPDYLPDGLHIEYKPPVYGFLSIPSLKELVYPGFAFFSVLYVFYSLLLLYVQILL